MDRYLERRQSQWRADLGRAIESMDVPEDRRYTWCNDNVHWLGEHLRTNNADHEHIDRAMDLVGSLLDDIRAIERNRFPHQEWVDSDGLYWEDAPFPSEGK